MIDRDRAGDESELIVPTDDTPENDAAEPLDAGHGEDQ